MLSFQLLSYILLSTVVVIVVEGSDLNQEVTYTELVP